MADLGPEPHPQPHVEGVSFAVPEEMPQGTPPPVPEGLPVVSLTDIALMEQKTGMRGRRVKSRRGSTTASHASLPQIPENVEITPLHARAERSDSMRDRVSVSQPGVSRLAEVQELEVRSRVCFFIRPLHCLLTPCPPPQVCCLRVTENILCLFVVLCTQMFVMLSCHR